MRTKTSNFQRKKKPLYGSIYNYIFYKTVDQFWKEYNKALKKKKTILLSFSLLL